MTAELETELAKQIEEMRPWHHDIELFDQFSTGKVFSPNGSLTGPENDGVTLISPQKPFLNRLDMLYPEGMTGKSFLDCACNGGGYCFWARERGVERAVGFDVREHWIQQAKFVQQHRTVQPTDRINFHVMDLYDVPKLSLQPFDMTFFSGLFYHLPDPVAGLRIAADLTTDILVLNTAMMANSENPRGLTMVKESRTRVMSGVHELAWFPNGKETLRDILLWMDFKDLKVTLLNEPKGKLRGRIEVIAGREKGRLANVKGDSLV